MDMFLSDPGSPSDDDSSGDEFIPPSDSGSDDSKLDLLGSRDLPVRSSAKRKWEADYNYARNLDVCGGPTLTADLPAPSGQTKAGCSSGLIQVHKATNSFEKRTWNKQNYCKFCEKGSTNLTKHLLSVDKLEQEVALILSKAKGSKERPHMLERLRNYGNYVHNCQVLKTGSGILIPWRSPSVEVDPAQYIPCEFCLGFFLKNDLWHHMQTCNFKENTKRGRKVIAKAKQLLSVDVMCSEGLKKHIFSFMSTQL